MTENKFQNYLLQFTLPLIAQLKQVITDYYARMYECESQKFDMEYECRKRELEVWRDAEELYAQVYYSTL